MLFLAPKRSKCAARDQNMHMNTCWDLKSCHTPNWNHTPFPSGFWTAFDASLKARQYVAYTCMSAELRLRFVCRCNYERIGIHSSGEVCWRMSFRQIFFLSEWHKLAPLALAAAEDFGQRSGRIGRACPEKPSVHQIAGLVCLRMPLTASVAFWQPYNTGNLTSPSAAKQRCLWEDFCFITFQLEPSPPPWVMQAGRRKIIWLCGALFTDFWFRLWLLRADGLLPLPFSDTVHDWLALNGDWSLFPQWRTLPPTTPPLATPASNGILIMCPFNASPWPRPVRDRHGPMGC